MCLTNSTVLTHAVINGEPFLPLRVGNIQSFRPLRFAPTATVLGTDGALRLPSEKRGQRSALPPSALRTPAGDGFPQQKHPVRRGRLRPGRDPRGRRPAPPTPVRCTMATHGTSRDPRRFRLPSHPKMAAPVGPVKFWKPGEGARPVCGAAVRGRRGLRMREFLPGLSVAGAGAKAAALPPAAVGSWGSHGFQTPRVSGETRCPSAAGAWRAARSL